ncbi:MAG: KUP/HAK/KT family potassium transporter [Fusobacteria bacterium]|nr:KUP/HAK/KT family potassium transporter [Fusobacteriota bacterium]
MHSVKKVIKALGIVFGDLGTSPIYTLTVIFIFIPITKENVFGIISLIFWTLMIIVTIGHVWLAMGINKNGEGGTVVLAEILRPYLKRGKSALVVLILSMLGLSCLIGDGVITPAMSILSATEGINLIPGFQNIQNWVIIIIAIIICIFLFSFQRKGVDAIAKLFGPLMVIWFLAIAISGLIGIFYFPHILYAINPYYALTFLWHNKIVGFLSLAEVILCATGGEALYADMGHIGKKPITQAWFFVCIALVLNYCGQGAFLLSTHNNQNILYSMIYKESQLLYVPFLIICIIATVIASQSIISGLFAIIYQGINTRIFPLLRVKYTSNELKSQIYIDSVNWLLLFLIILLMVLFKTSDKLAAAYGFAVLGTMVITGILATWYLFLKRKRMKFIFSVIVTLVYVLFFIATMTKITQGAYWSILIGIVPLIITLVYTFGQRRLYGKLKSVRLENFLERYNHYYSTQPVIPGTALFLTRDIRFLPPFINRLFYSNNIIYEKNVILSIIITEEPFGTNCYFEPPVAPGFQRFVIEHGYKIQPNVNSLMLKNNLKPTVIFYGIEHIQSRSFIWKLYSLIKKLTPSYVEFYRIKPSKLHGIITRVKM